LCFATLIKYAVVVVVEVEFVRKRTNDSNFESSMMSSNRRRQRRRMRFLSSFFERRRMRFFLFSERRRMRFFSLFERRRMRSLSFSLESQRSRVSFFARVLFVARDATADSDLMSNEERLRAIAQHHMILERLYMTKSRAAKRRTKRAEAKKM
jgi:hypothetical protein